MLKNINNELDFIYKIIYSIMFRLKESYKNYIISQENYNTNMDKLEEIVNKYKQYKLNINLKTLKRTEKFKIIKIISKIKLDLINISKKTGIYNLEDLVRLVFNKTLNNIKTKYDNKFYSLFIFFNNIFCPTNYNIYSSIEEIKLSTLTNKINYPICTINNELNTNLLDKLMGCKLYLPINNKLLLIKGYFHKDPLNLYRLNPIFKNKNNKIKKLINKYNNIPKLFKEAYINQISIRNFIINNAETFLEKCETNYNILIKLKKKNISNIVKEFLTGNIEKQIEIITLFLLNKDDTDTQYLAYLMYDMISNESYLLKPQPLAEQVFNSLHWSVQKLFKIAFKKIDNINNKNNNFSEDSISYDKRIHLMKVSKNVKNKAFDKLKEINSSKGETNAKAQQYLDGILKIPFGIYKKEPILSFLEEFIEKSKIYSNFIINLLKDYNYKENKLINNLYNKCNKLLYCKKFTSKILQTFINNINNNLIEIKNINNKNQEIKYNFFSKYTVKKLKELLTKYKLSKTGLKKDLIDRVIKNFNLLDKNEIPNLILQLNILLIQNSQLDLINEKTINLYNLYNKYISDRKQYLTYVDESLDKAVYGLENAKLQIKRIIAQWINGNNSGYVFGFEGPAGTGKTTLAKKGIANAIIDNEKNPRPFIFIALGGTSNGSTLEGHNYTYVGSTWGKIVDCLIETKCMNPIIYIDELDKVSKTEHGKEIIGILIHMTDPSQNEEFTDKYFSGVKIDISKCLIIFSYNDASLIDKILLDRIHRIKTEQLTRFDKIQIVNNYMLPDILQSVGFEKDDIIIDEDILSYIIDTYTNEAGVRKLKERLFEIIREVNLRYLLGEITIFPYKIKKEMIEELFTHKPKVHLKKISDKPSIGLVNGLYATSTGLGGITIIETFTYLSEQRLTLELTGQQGNVMKESMSVAKTVAWNLLPKSVKSNIRKNEPFGIHIHCPEAATPKDGPSAGAAITTAIYSLLTKIPVNNLFAITGEIDLNGKILAIGGLNLKVDGAKKAGIKTVLCPKENEDDLIKIREGKNPLEDDNFKIIMVEHISEVLDYMLVKKE